MKRLLKSHLKQYKMLSERPLAPYLPPSHPTTTPLHQKPSQMPNVYIVLMNIARYYDPSSSCAQHSGDSFVVFINSDQCARTACYLYNVIKGHFCLPQIFTLLFTLLYSHYYSHFFCSSEVRGRPLMDFNELTAVRRM